MNTPRPDPLETAVTQHVAAVLSIPADGTLLHSKVRFVALDGQSIWIETATEQTHFSQQIADGKTTVGMTFRLEQTKFIFTTVVAEIQQDGASLPVPPARLRLQRPNPSSVKSVQRRVGYRSSVSPTADCAVRAWKITEEQRLDKKAPSSSEVPLEIHDISEGGMGFSTKPRDGKPYELAVNQRLRVTVTFEGRELLVEGRVRHYKTLPDLSLIVGVQFVQQANDPAGRQTSAGIQRVVSQLARHEARWQKMSA